MAARELLAQGARAIAVSGRRDLTSREIRGEATVLRPAVDADADLLVAWHDDPEIARYWDDERFKREELLGRLRRPDVEAYIVEADGEPVGYLQVWQEGSAGGLDMFLVPGARGRGLGSDAGGALARHLRDERAWRRVTVDPYLWNEPAIRAWRRAGFVDLDEHEPDDDHTARWLVMEFRG
jgi:aminoglycoside 6'-N-acetyltransferase